MGGLDELVDNQQDEVVEQEVEGLMDELDIESKEELEKFQDRLKQLSHGLVHYDKRMEEIESRLEVLEGVTSKILKEVSDTNKQDVDDDPNTTAGSQGSSWGTSESGLDWQDGD